MAAARASSSQIVVTSPIATARDVIVLTKPRITLLSAIVAAGAMALAPGSLDPMRAVLTLLGISLAVAGAGALNMLVERDVDALMKRTAGRPLPAHRLAPAWALGTGALLSVLAFPVLWHAAGALSCALTAFSLFVYVLVYTPMKRTSPWALVVGAVPGAMPALMGSTAVAERIELVGLALFGVVFLWQLPHFVAIGIYREQDYSAAGHKIVSALWGVALARAFTVVSTFLLAVLGVALWPIGVASALFGVVAALLGAAFVAVTLRGPWSPAAPRADVDAWARKVFIASLLYLTLLFAALGADAVVARLIA